MLYKQSVARPVASTSAGASSRTRDADMGASTKASLPEGFFSDKSADAKARGEKLPDEKQKQVLSLLFPL